MSSVPLSDTIIFGLLRLSIKTRGVADGALHRAEIAKWWPIIKEANIKAE